MTLPSSRLHLRSERKKQLMKTNNTRCSLERHVKIMPASLCHLLHATTTASTPPSSSAIEGAMYKEISCTQQLSRKHLRSVLPTSRRVLHVPANLKINTYYDGAGLDRIMERLKIGVSIQDLQSRLYALADGW